MGSPVAMPAENHYSVLGVSRSANADEIRRAYRRLAKSLHPDINSGPDAAAKFAAVARAYEVLSDAKLRREHDTRLDHPSPTPASVDRRAHYSWRNVASDATPARPDNRADLEDLFQTYFGGDNGRV